MREATAFICEACGTEYPPSSAEPSSCPICEEERQFVPSGGQTWTTLDELARTHSNALRQHEPQLIEIITVPAFAIGQRAFLLLSPEGNVLWDCVALVDAATITAIGALGGMAAIAISHPHYYTTMGRWADAFDTPVYLHADDRQWVMRPDDRLVFWEGASRTIGPGMTLIRCGGHFAGATVLHWAAGSAGRGTLLSGDVLQVLPGRQHVSFMRSYPNLIPLSAKVVQRIVERLAPYDFERVYGAFAEREILAAGKEAVHRSAERYMRAVGGEGPADREP